ncbi:MAG: hypothetical protein C4341_06030 [Armatimonadota bacterium]
MKRLLALMGLATLASVAGAVIIETEPNNTFEQANAITRGSAPWADVGVMSLTAGGGDVDFFSIQLFQGEFITIITTPIETPYTDPDTILGLFDDTHQELAFNDDAGSGFGSAIRWQATYTGTHYIAVSGYGDRQFRGEHRQDGPYILTVSVVPEPATLLAVGAGLAALVVRRRTR